MKIPHTVKLEPVEVDLHMADSELFAFCVEEFTEDTYFHVFIEKLDEYLPRFVFSKRNLEIKQAQYDSGKTTATPLDQARALLQKTKLEHLHNSTGELGEFLMFLFAQEVKGAQKIASKIQSRGTTGVPIHGRDGIYILNDENGNVYMLSGEAKMKPDGNDGLREAQGDLNRFWQSGNISHEILLASTHLVDEVTQENYEKYAPYFLQGNPAQANLKYKNIIFIGYNSENFTKLRSGQVDEATFFDTVKADLARCFQNQKKLIKTGNKSAIYCFVPFETVDSAREAFARHNGLLID